jgi:hypothetical protein
MRYVTKLLFFLKKKGKKKRAGAKRSKFLKVGYGVGLTFSRVLAGFLFKIKLI